jgi:hypothetical protein
MKAPNSIEDVTKSYKDNPPVLLTDRVSADNREGRRRKTVISCACEGPEGYLGIVMLGEVSPGYKKTINIAGNQWHVTKYQFNWFEWFPNNPNPVARSGPLREARPGHYFTLCGVKWTEVTSFTPHEEVEDDAA